MNTLNQKEKSAIDALKAFEPKSEPYYLCYSGGKDSDVIRILAQLAGVKHECKHNLTTADAPETIKYVAETIGSENIERAHYDDGTPVTMWNLIPKKLMPPTRLVRYCCERLKEHGGTGRLKITGVRWAESTSRKNNNNIVVISRKTKTVKKIAEEYGADAVANAKGGLILSTDNTENRRLVEHCYRFVSTRLNPIIDWSDSDVWEFLKHYGVDGNPLYQCGESRVGCLLCPMGGGRQQKREAALYPKYKQMYIHAFDRMIEERKRKNLSNEWANGEEVYTWWVGDDPNQITINAYLNSQ